MAAATRALFLKKILKIGNKLLLNPNRLNVRNVYFLNS